MDRTPRTLITIAVVLFGCAPDQQSSATTAEEGAALSASQDLALAVVAEADRLAEAELWPGFDPTTTPVAIYTGKATLLFRHPTPPDGFEALAGHPRTWTYPGRHAAMVANTSTDLGGVQTATIMLGGDARSVRSAAGLLAHELFHVFQRERHPEWGANEAALFTYPVDAVEPLASRRLETEALLRALASDEAGQARCWAEAALTIRSRRFSALPPEAAAYERGTELNEGLASYVEQRATAGESGEAVFPEQGFPPAAVRQRSYAAGLALALLLDRFAPDWKNALDQDTTASLDGLLSEAVRGARSPACEFSVQEREDAGARAVRDIATLDAERAERVRAFQEQEGWRLVVNATEAPLPLQGFDPLNVEVVGPGAVLHDHLLRLGSSAATLEILNRAVLTTAAGEHPLFDGVRSVTVTGLSEEPTITRAEGTTRIQAEGVEIEFTGGDVTRAEQTIEVVLEQQTT